MREKRMPYFDHFEILAPIYDRLFQPRYAGQLIALAGLPTQGPLLDVGGGTGRVAQMLRGLAGQVIVADISLGMLRQAAGKDGLSGVCTPAENLPFEAESFSHVIVVDAFHHVCDQEATVRELWRVLQKRGRIVIEEPDIRSPMVWVVAAVEKLLLMRSRFVSPRRIAAMFNFEGAQTSVTRQGYTGWVVVEKKPKDESTDAR